MSHPLSEVVVTGVGVVSPIGIGREPFWDALCQGRSGVGPIRLFDASALPVGIAAEVNDFDPKSYVTPRKSLKVMCRDAQLGVAAATLACRDAGIANGSVDPERLGVVLGADRICSSMQDSLDTYGGCYVDGQFDYNRWGTAGLAATFPLSFLRVLPNMIASHISIAHDARGPNNTIHQAEVSSLVAIGEAARVIQRGAADAMLAGGASSQMNPFDCVRRCAMGILTAGRDDPAAAMRPFDAQRDGLVWGEGAAMFVVESRSHAEARRANVLARLLGWAAVGEPLRSRDDLKGTGLRRAVHLALHDAGLGPAELGHVNAHGESSVRLDRLEAAVLHETVPAVPVTAPKSYFGSLGAATGAVEMAASVLALDRRSVPATLNYRDPDPDCPVEVIRDRSLESRESTALTVNLTRIGQAAAVVLGGPD